MSRSSNCQVAGSFFSMIVQRSQMRPHPTAWTSIVYARRRPSIPQGGERGGEQPTPERYDLVAIVENDTERKRVIGGVPQTLQAAEIGRHGCAAALTSMPTTSPASFSITKSTSTWSLSR